MRLKKATTITKKVGKPYPKVFNGSKVEVQVTVVKVP